MNLRKKLFTIFGGLALLSISTAGVTVWAIAQWHTAEAQLQDHYQRSLLLQQIRAATFRATREISDALLDQDPDAIEEFQAALEPVESDFQRWSSLADHPEEKQQVTQIRQAHDSLRQTSLEIFRLLDNGRTKDAIQLAEGRLEERDFRRFERLTAQAVLQDQSYREIVRSKTQNTRQTAQWVLLLAAIGVLSLILLLTAYLSSDLFAPLRDTETALDDVARGDLQRRMDENRQDELGAIHRAFNRMVDAIAQRERILQVGNIPTQSSQANAHSEGDQEQNPWQDTPSRVTLHRLVTELRSQVTQLQTAHSNNGHQIVPTQEKHQIIQQLDHLLQAIARMTEFGFPLDLNLAPTDVRSLLYEVLLRFHDEFMQRNISYELQIDPNVQKAVVDRLKLREALGELVRNALAALPEQGGRLGMRASCNESSTELFIEVADDGRGAEQPLINQTFDTFGSPKERPNVGLKLTRAIIEQHGGNFAIASEPNRGTYVQIHLPLRT